MFSNVRKGSERTSPGKGLLEQEDSISIKTAFRSAGGNSDAISAGKGFPDQSAVRWEDKSRLAKADVHSRDAPI